MKTEKLFTVGGRTYHRDEQGRVLVWNTDYGAPTPLFLLTDHPITIASAFAAIRVVNEKGEGNSVLIGSADAVELSVRLGMKIAANGKTYEVKEV